MSQSDYTSHIGIVPFHNIVQSEGEGFNKKTGIFTAKFDGIYLFSISALTVNEFGAKYIALKLGCLKSENLLISNLLTSKFFLQKILTFKF